MTGDCDCCGNYSTTLRRVWYLGYMETFACAKCRHDDEEEENQVDQKSDRVPSDRMVDKNGGGNCPTPDYAMNDYEIRKYTGVK